MRVDIHLTISIITLNINDKTIQSKDRGSQTVLKIENTSSNSIPSTGDMF